MFKKTKVEITKSEAIAPFKTAFIGGVYSAFGTIVTSEIFELLSAGVKIAGEKIVEKINERKQPDSHFDEEFWDELFDDETDGKEEE